MKTGIVLDLDPVKNISVKISQKMLGVFCIFTEGLEGHVNFFSLEIEYRYLWQADPPRFTPIVIQTQTNDV